MFKGSPLFLYIMLGITLVVAALFYLGGVIDPSTERPEPVYTDAMLYWLYIVLSLCATGTVIFTIRKFFIELKSSPRKAFKFVILPLVLVIVMAVAWSLGDGTPLQILR